MTGVTNDLSPCHGRVPSLFPMKNVLHMGAK